ncbi:MAG TPA: c-type cytochrome [Gammaproteobacteria bacterium]|nr:c-type cytochrome [Gammaproteobacteria bacterium]
MNKWFVFTAVVSMLAVSGPSLAAGDAAAGKTKSASCVACHGADGNSMNPEWPTLAGQHPDYLVKQLRNFKDGDRNNALMSPMAAPLSDQDMQDLAAYYASQTAKPGQADPDLVEQGRQLYRGGNMSTGVAACIACHGPMGAGNPPANFPALAGQHAAYTVNQLKAFKRGERANDAGKMMQNIAAKMSEAEMQAVASYIQGMQ